jgi:hypothetical protein
MLTYKQIIKTITDMLISKFPLIEVQESDVEEGFKRPSFFISLDGISRDSRKYYSIRSITIRIHFFPTDRYIYSLEVLGVQQELEELFDLTIKVEDRVIPISDTSSLIVDKTLEFDINIEYYEKPLPDGSTEPPLMQELINNVRYKL